MKQSISRLCTAILPLLFAGFFIGCDSSTSEPEPPTVLIVGGHDYHDFDRWYDQEDSAIIAETGATVSYTDELETILPQLDDLDILYLSNNQLMTDPELHRAIEEFVAAGNGLIIGHAAGWNLWRDAWPEYYSDFIGGSTSSHPPVGEFEVYLTDESHPIMDGVPSSFRIIDELYRFSRDESGAEMNVLAMAVENEDAEYPAIWTVEYGEGDVVNITLGHDGESHQHEAYITFLKNTIHWLNGQ